jgi:hypothetical protein
MESFPVKAKKCGRPKGRQHDATIHVRLPSPAVRALARLAAVEKLAVADLVRGSIVSLLNGAAPRMVDVARNGKAAPAARMRAAEMVRWIGTFCLYLGPDGLKLARRKAALEAAAVEGTLPEAVVAVLRVNRACAGGSRGTVGGVSNWFPARPFRPIESPPFCPCRGVLRTQIPGLPVRVGFL